jgi:hypothetical protein
MYPEGAPLQAPSETWRKTGVPLEPGDRIQPVTRKAQILSHLADRPFKRLRKRFRRPDLIVVSILGSQGHDIHIGGHSINESSKNHRGSPDDHDRCCFLLVGQKIANSFEGPFWDRILHGEARKVSYSLYDRL